MTISHTSEQLLAYKNIISKHFDQSTIQSKCPVSGSDLITTLCNQIIRIQNKKQFLISDDHLLFCEKSGIIFTSRLMPRPFYYQYINEFYGVNPVTVHPVSNLKARFRLNIIELAKELTCKEIDSALEISSFDGCTLSAIHNNICNDVYGIEPTIQAVKCSENTYSELRGKIANCLFEDLPEQYPQSIKKYDLVLSSHALQQMAYPLDAFKILENIVANDGILIIDEGVFLNELTTLVPDKLVRSFHQQKNYLFTTHILRYFLAQHGFKYLFSKRYHLAPGPQMFEHFSAMVFQKKHKTEVNDQDLEAARTSARAVISLFMSNRPSDDHTIEILKNG